MIPTPVIASIIGAVAGGLVGWLGNYQLQYRIHRRLRGVDDLKDRLYALLEIVSRYWIAGGATEHERRSLEAELVAAQHVVISEFVVLRRVNRKMRRARREIDALQLDLLDTATGGEFQQADWKPDPQRVVRMARIVTRIVRMLA